MKRPSVDERMRSLVGSDGWAALKQGITERFLLTAKRTTGPEAGQSDEAGRWGQARDVGRMAAYADIMEYLESIENMDPNEEAAQEETP